MEDAELITQLSKLDPKAEMLFKIQEGYASYGADARPADEDDFERFEENGLDPVERTPGVKYVIVELD